MKLLLPTKSDSFVVNTTSQSNFQELLDIDVKIYTYNKGFIHAKTMVCDQKLAIIRTANFDNRSFDLNFEINAIVYNEQIANELRDLFEKDLAFSTQILSEQWAKRRWYRKVTEKVLHLFSSFM